MLGVLLVAAVVALAGRACALPDVLGAADVGVIVAEELGVDEGLGVGVDDGVVVRKRDLEFNQYVPGYRLRGEPSCEELRAMWRLSKREARRATSTNQLPRARPYTYGRLVAFAPDPNAGPSAPVYGRIWKGRYPPYGQASSSQVPVKGSFEKLKMLMLVDGGGSPRGQFDALRGMLAMDRGPGVSSKGRLKELIGLSASERVERRPVALALRAEQPYSPPRDPPPLHHTRSMRGPRHYTRQGFVGPLLPGDSRGSSPSTWHPPAPDLSLRSCQEVSGMGCRANSECACGGIYRCSKGRCRTTAVMKDDLGWWMREPVPEQDLGIHKWSPGAPPLLAHPPTAIRDWPNKR